MPNSPNIITVAGIFTASTALGRIVYFIINLFSTVTVVVNMLRGEV